MEFNCTLYNYCMQNYNDLLDEIFNISRMKKSRLSGNILGISDEYLGIPIPSLKKLAKKYKNLNLNEYKIDNIFELRLIYFLIGISNTITFNEGIDFILKNKDEYIGWAVTDSTYQYISFDKNFNEIYPTLKSFLKDKNEYIRRLAYLICFKYLKNRENLSNIFRLFKNDNAYYVQMVESWLICELYIFYQEETFMFLKESNLDKIIVNKAISKIHDSYRVTKENKEKAKLLRK